MQRHTVQDQDAETPDEICEPSKATFLPTPTCVHVWCPSLVPCNWQQARELDKANGNTRWLDAERLELQQINDYNTFKDLGEDFEKIKRRLKDHKKIKVHMVYACKYDGRHKCRLVAGATLRTCLLTLSTPASCLCEASVSLPS